MPLLTQEKMIKEYYDEVKDKFSDVNFERFESICKSPMNFVKQMIKCGELPLILIKHIGKFRVFKGKIKRELASQERFFNKGIITEDIYTERKKFFKKYLNDLTYETETTDDIEGTETID